MAPEEFSTGDEKDLHAARLRRDGDRIAVRLRGEHDLATAGLVSAALAEAIAVDPGDVVVDLGEVEFMDASAVRVLVRGCELLRARARRLTVRSPQPGPRKVLELCGLDQLIEDEPTGTRRAGQGAQRALETWVAVPAAGVATESPQPTRREITRDDPEASRQ